MQIFEDSSVKTPLIVASVALLALTSSWLAARRHRTGKTAVVVTGKPSRTLKDRLGGDAAIDAAVAEFYRRVPTDPHLAPFFVGFSIDRLKRHQRSFLTNAFTDNPRNLDLHDLMIRRHATLFQERGLKAEHFDMVAGHLVATLEHLGVEPALVGEAAAVVLALRPAFEKGEAQARSAQDHEVKAA